MCTAKEALYLERMLVGVDPMGRLVAAGGGKKPSGAAVKLQHQLTTIATAAARTELVGHNELGVKNGHGGMVAVHRSRLPDARLLEEELKRSSRSFCEQQNRLNKLNRDRDGDTTDFDLGRKPDPTQAHHHHLWSSALKVPKKLKGKLAAHVLKDKEANKENSINGGDHNRLAGATPTSKTSTTGGGAANSSPKPLAKSLIRSTTVSNTTPPTTTTTTATTANHHANTPPHLLNHHASGNNGVATAPTPTATVKAIQRNGTIILDKSSTTPLLICDAKPTAEDTTEKIVHRRQGICDSSLYYRAATIHLHLDAFSCPTIKTAHQKTTADLLETKSILDEERTHSQTLKQQLLETNERETELEKLHRCELSRVETCLSEQQRSSDDRIASLEDQLLEKECRNRELLSRIDGYEAKLVDQAAQLESSRARELDLLQRINALSCTENELRDKVHTSELAFSERLQAAAMRERDLTEQINGLNRELERMRRETERKERELEEQLTITKDECVVLRQSRNASVEPGQNGTATLANTSGSNQQPQLNRSSSNINHLQVLQDEVDSLRCVLDLKQREISELRKQTQEYERDAKELPGALTKISALESRIEDLVVQLKTKTEEEKEMQQKLKHLQDNLHQETKIKSRLSLHNEELQWRLKQNSEKFTLAYAELSKSYHENSSFMMNATKSSLDQSAAAHQSHHHHQLSHNQSRSSCSDRFFDMDDISPPTSPVIKGMVEKSDSVSWVLEIDDEPPEVSASRMVRRAGSFRSNGAYDSVAKRPKCGTSALNQTTNGIQQSTSAASILKQHSSDLSAVKSVHGPAGTAVAAGLVSSSSSHRLRSKSVSIKAAEPPKKIVRSNSGASASPCVGLSCKPLRMTDMPGSWKEQPLYSSSPYAHKRYLSEGLELGAPSSSGKEHHHRAKDLFLEESELLSEPDSPFQQRPKLNGFGVEESGIANPPVEIFHRDKTPNFKKSKENRGLITCDTTALTGSKATGGGGLTARDKRREFTRKAGAGIGATPKEAAGEALVSGSNTDDEASSTSSASSSSCISEGSLSSSRSTGSSSNSSHDNSPLHCGGGSTGSGKRSSDRMNNDHDENDTVEDDGHEGGDTTKESPESVASQQSARVHEHHHHQHHRRHHHHHHHHHSNHHSNLSLEDALMKKIVAGLNGGEVADGNDTPMEVSWSEDGDPGSESNV
uniref:Uncharacterized protein n=1 Tax=Anopheles farauti TaxID=69004 RepID=A0A182QHU5_9DIPT